MSTPYPELDALGNRRIELALAEARGPGVIEVDSVNFRRYVPEEALRALADRHALPYLRKRNPVEYQLPYPMGAVNGPRDIYGGGPGSKRISAFGYVWAERPSQRPDLWQAFSQAERRAEIDVHEGERIAAVLENAPFESKRRIALRLEESKVVVDAARKLTTDQWEKVRKEFEQYATEVNRAVDACNVRLVTALLEWATEYERDASTLRAAQSDRWEAKTKELDRSRRALARVVAGPLPEWYWAEAKRIALRIEPEVTARRGARPLEAFLFDVRMLATTKLEEDLAEARAVWSFVEEELDQSGTPGQASPRDELPALLQRRLSEWIGQRVKEFAEVLKRHGYAVEAVSPFTLHPRNRPIPSDNLTRVLSGRPRQPEALPYWPEPYALQREVSNVVGALTDLLEIAAAAAEQQRQARRAEAEARAAALWADAVNAQRGESTEVEPGAQP